MSATFQAAPRPENIFSTMRNSSQKSTNKKPLKSEENIHQADEQRKGIEKLGEF